MDERKRRILEAIVRDYIRTAEPVSSRTIARNYELGISAATIRNEMFDLEQAGFLEQPHTSAGRVPSAKGYRFYVDAMAHPGEATEEDTHRIRELWQSMPVGSEAFFFQFAKMISQISHSISLFLAPAHDRSILRYIHVLPVGDGKAVMVVVTDTGALDNEPIHFGADADEGEIQLTAVRFGNALKDTLLVEITTDRLATAVATVDGSKQMLALMAEALYRAVSKRKLFYAVGTTELLGQPEFKNVEKVQSILSLLEERDQLSTILSRRQRRPLSIRIGEENEAETLRDVSLIRAEYGEGTERHGTLAILGPTRMEYGRIIGMLTYIHELLRDMESGRKDEHDERRK